MNNASRVLISVIVPVFNVMKYLDDCVISIINQTFKDFEIILIDDGSTDGSGDICDKYSNTLEFIRTFHKINGGLSDARNFGVLKAEGNFVTFVDSDDCLNPMFLEILYNACIQNDVDISLCSYVRFNDVDAIDYSKLTKINYENSIDVLSRNDILKNLLTPNISTKFEVGTCKLIKKNLFNDVTFPVGKVHEDTATTYRLFAQVAKVAVSSNGLYYYRYREGSITSQFKRNRLELIDILLDRQNFFNRNYSEELSIKHFLFLLNRICILYYEAKDDNFAFCEIKMKLDEIIKIKYFRKISCAQRVKFILYIKYPMICFKYIKKKNKMLKKTGCKLI